jgi:hypothetical protein
MIRWNYEQMNMFTYWVEIRGEYNELLYPKSIISAPAMAILKDILTDYLFALQINHTNTIFNYEELSPEDRMDLLTMTIHKLEEEDNDNE